jgi:2-polyprenyl-6-methoxyphenol hydroxylase-like FAD-dependent oxidoreductase
MTLNAKLKGLDPYVIAFALPPGVVMTDDERHLLMEDLAKVLLEKGTLVRSSTYDVRLTKAPQVVVKNRLFFIGDAARTTDPSRTLGLNYAINDALAVGELFENLGRATTRRDRVAAVRQFRDEIQEASEALLWDQDVWRRYRSQHPDPVPKSKVAP